ncbi:hypothetical protein [Paludibaculum fermentans]|uniref:hypothetical protein n=1 Tax=Paludibaculum fermentans TaxID=1473598 RepID=UPI003EBEB8D8
MNRCVFLLSITLAACWAEQLPVRVTWGHGSKAAAAMPLQVTADGGMTIGSLAKTGAADGAVDGLRFILESPARTEPKLQKLQVIWADLLAAADADTARRLGDDAAMDPHAPRLYVKTRGDGTGGFAVTIEQLKRERAIWVPSLDLYITAGDPFVPFAEHLKSLAPWKGQRILEQIQAAPEASYEEYTGRWEDMGSPAYVNPQQTGAGHIIGLAWDSSIHKFGIDRGAGVRNDFGNPDRFRFWFEVGDITKGIARSWKKQGLFDGLPLVTTVFEREGIHYEIEQFAYPLEGPPSQRRGDMRMVLMQRLRVTTLDGKARRIPINLSHRRAMPGGLSALFEVEQSGAKTVVHNRSFGQTLLEIDGGNGRAVWSGVQDYDDQKMRRVNLSIPLEIPAQGAGELIVKLPSPMVDAAGAELLAKLDYDQARTATVNFWNSWLDKGAQFQVPEKVVNDLFRASLWHALRLPRRHGTGDDTRIDLPYSNFAYDQTGTPWPVNQAVYIDYMLFGLRGYGDVAAEELKAQYRNNQELNGHVSGYANWLVYTPGMLYATAQNYFLSGDKAALQRVMPESLKALEWCMAQVAAAQHREGPAKGLVSGPLNDLTGEGLWAFNQAYMYAGLDLFGKALEQLGHPQGAAARAAAKQLASAVDHGFRTASANSPLVQLRDHTWIPYVPCEANTFRRILDDWYPTDVDTGAAHMLRLKAVAPTSDLADWLLNDHEDNLFIRGWGIANEPVYNQTATAYLWRDDPKAVIRTFYSYMASAFSHSALEPVEHRSTHGQYFGPPSTDGAWFELYRNMLILERDDDSLLLAGFTPRAWLGEGKTISVKRAPSRFGPVSMTIENKGGRQLKATVELGVGARPSALLVRFRHPAGSRMTAVTVNGREWTDFDAAKEWVRLPAPQEKSHAIVVRY